MFKGKMKAVTFSYDDGVTQDQRLISIFNRYDLKCTFNLNSGLLGQADMLQREGVSVAHCKPLKEEIRGIYAGHEIAAHTLTHPALSALSDQEIIRQVEDDRLALSEIAGYEVVGMAYPGGTDFINEHVASLIRNHTGIKYARTTTSTHNFDLQADLIMSNPTVYHHFEWEELFRLGEEFLALKTDTPKVFYIWGHSYEFDIRQEWDRFEKFCALISHADDIYYSSVTAVEVFGEILIIEGFFVLDNRTNFFLVGNKIASVILVGVIFHVAEFISRIEICNQRAVVMFGSILHSAFKHMPAELGNRGYLTGYNRFYSIQFVLIRKILIDLAHGVYERERISGRNKRSEFILKLAVSKNLNFDRLVLFIHALDFVCWLTDAYGAEVVGHKVMFAREFHNKRVLPIFNNYCKHCLFFFLFCLTSWN